MVAICVGFNLLLLTSRTDLEDHYHVGLWGSRLSLFLLFGTLEAIGWLIAACAVATLVLMIVQRQRLRAAYPA
jgi:hypothetical protein